MGQNADKALHTEIEPSELIPHNAFTTFRTAGMRSTVAETDRVSACINFQNVERMTSDVFLLGAGFSRAISPDMPTTDELGSHVITQQKSIHASKTTSHSSIK